LPLSFRSTSPRCAPSPDRATALVAAVYLVVAVAVVAFVTGSLTAQVDQRLATALEHTGGGPPRDGDGPGGRPPGERFDPVRAMWIVLPDGSVLNDGDDPPLPAEHQGVTAPASVTLDGVDVRIAGAATADGHVVVGESLRSVNDARATIIVGELLVAPILLVIVFLGSLAVGRRVATPIELARRRQLEFTADASHELRTPLAVIEANASLALTQDRELDWYRSAFGNVDAEAKRMRRLLDDLLWLARFDATDAPAHAEPVDLGVLAEQTADRFAPVAEAKQLAFEVRADPAGVTVAAPPDLLDRLLGVLLDNACKYAPEGGSVAVSVVAEGGRVVLTVDDSGPGIPEAERERVFDRFHRATDGAGGAGLGLAIADAIVRATSGRWTVASSPAGGARMAVSWPRDDAGGGHESVPVHDRAATTASE
jgi:signal transduction histidine kinase